MTNDKIKYAKTAAIWELVMASWLCISMNVFTNFTNYFQYYLTGIVGVGTVLAGSFITIFRIWDAFTDLGVGAAVDRTNTKLGQFRRRFCESVWDSVYR